MREVVACAVAGIVLVFHCVCLYWAAKSWYAAARLYERLPVLIAVRTMGWTVCTSNQRHAILPFLSILTIGVLGWLTELGWFLLLPLASGALVILLNVAEPPSVLFLGSSQWSTVRYIARLQRGIHPYRVVFLLNPESADQLQASWLNHAKFGIDNLRIFGAHDWRRVVFVFVDRVALVVLDTRIPSPAVIDEVRYVLERGLSHKVLFVINPDGTSPLLDSLAGAGDRSKLVMVKETEVLARLRERGCTRTQSPYDNPWAFVLSGKKIASKMWQVGKTIPGLTEALRRAREAHGETLVVHEATLLLERIIGPPGARLEQALADLDRDHVAADSFVRRWSDEKLGDYQEVVSEAKRMCQALAELQIAVDAAPPDFLRQVRQAANRD